MLPILIFYSNFDLKSDLKRVNTDIPSIHKSSSINIVLSIAGEEAIV